MSDRLEIRLTQIPAGPITAQSFALCEDRIVPPGPGEVVVLPLCISLDPYLSIQIHGRPVRSVTLHPGDPVRSRMVGRVTDSRHGRIRTGDLVRGIAPWSTACTVPGDGLEVLPDTGLPLEMHLSVLGASGLTAWVGLHRVGRITAGETVIITGAGGTVGSLAGQLALLHGCNVIGIAGGPEKCAQVRGQGILHCLDHRAPDFAALLAEVTADLLFENVGGRLMDAVLPQIRDHSRIVLCGMIAHYDKGAPVSFRNLDRLLEGCIEVRPFRVSEYSADHARAQAELAQAVAEGKLRCAHTITLGIASIPAAFVRVTKGEVLGKAVVSLVERSA